MMALSSFKGGVYWVGFFFNLLIQVYGRSGPDGVALKCLHYFSELAKKLSLAFLYSYIS